ncbi:hypothetical protein MM239_18985 [Belliella sp. DSM 111904]|uniref:Peptidase S74 domain-containing protein n=1 Tax=Belliella filtrata TaxID=2923435 RepID=A0ABS9V4Z8_9BACT|nr:hypothetical protein [Belliella filtrata]MCH7411481.1 hypothetical protein [Belliella filtrata]
MKNLSSLFIFLLASFINSNITIAQISGSFVVGGNLDTFYPVTWFDGAWDSNIATELQIGRSSGHTNSQWRGAIIANFRFHTTNWGHEANFIDAHIVKSTPVYNNSSNFIAGWTDVSGNNNGKRILIWLRGGNTTYFYNANSNVSPNVYDGVQNSLPYSTPNLTSTFDIKNSIEQYAKGSGNVFNHPFYVRGGNSLIMGNLGIGSDPKSNRLEVNGNIRAKELKLEATNWPDYVFSLSYELMSLPDVKRFIDQNGHLPGFQTADYYNEEGVKILELNQKLLEKIEEIMLHMIAKDAEINLLKSEIIQLKELEKEILLIKKSLN